MNTKTKNLQKRPALVIMAAGLGNRYGGLKQLEPLGSSGETIMDYSVFNAIEAEFGKVVFVIRHSFESEFRKQVLSKYAKRIHSEVVFQEIDSLPAPFVAPKDRVRPWGTGHALLMASEVVNEPFCVINADDYYGKEAFFLMKNALTDLSVESCGEYFTVCYSLDNTLSESGTVSRGICSLNCDGTLENVVEYKKLIRHGDKVIDEETGYTFLPSTLVSMNFWGFTPDYFTYSENMFKEYLKKYLHNEQSEFYIPTVVSSLISEGKASIKVIQSQESWFGVTYANDRPSVVRKLFQLHTANVYPTPLFSSIDK